MSDLPRPLTDYEKTVNDFIALLQALRAWRKVINLYYQGRLIGRATVNFAGLMQKSSRPEITIVDHFDDDPNIVAWRKLNGGISATLGAASADQPTETTAPAAAENPNPPPNLPPISLSRSARFEIPRLADADLTPNLATTQPIFRPQDQAFGNVPNFDDIVAQSLMPGIFPLPEFMASDRDARLHDLETQTSILNTKKEEYSIGSNLPFKHVGSEFGFNLVSSPAKQIEKDSEASVEKLDDKPLSYDQILKLVNDNNNSGQSNELIIAIIYKESRFKPNAKNSKSSATGLMQLEDISVQELQRVYKKFQNLDRFDPAQSISAGSQYVRLMIERNHGNVAAALNKFGTGSGYSENIINAEQALKGTGRNPLDVLRKEIGPQ